MASLHNVAYWAATRSFVVMLAYLGAAFPVLAESDKFLCIEGIQGSSTDAQFQGCSNVFGYSQAVEVQRSGSGGGAGAPKPIGCGEAIVIKEIDAASPVLFLRVLTGFLSGTATVHFRTQGDNPVEFLTIRLQNVSIDGIENSEFSEGVGPPSQLPITMESIKLSAGQVFITFTPVGSDGSLGTPVEAGYDCVADSRL
jgi:type VI secretion system secreted protein Hcp